MEREREIRATFASQAVWCARLGSPLTAMVVGILGEVLDHSTATGRRVLTWAGRADAMGDGVALRVAGALNGLVQAGELPDLAQLYPPNTLPNKGKMTSVLRGAVRDADAQILRWLGFPPQTNEVARAAVLYSGMAAVAQATGLPLAIFEVGASAGLNLIPDRYAYDLGGVVLGRADSAVKLGPEWVGARPPAVEPQIVARRGCDLSPLNMADVVDRARLTAYIWADQPERRARVEAAIALLDADLHAAETPIVDKVEAADWVVREIGVTPQKGVVRVLFHSIAYQYFPSDTQARIAARMEAAGACARIDAPLAWLGFEQDGENGPRLTLRLWPDGQRWILAQADAHVRKVTWFPA